MRRLIQSFSLSLATVLLLLAPGVARSQTSKRAANSDGEFGPVMRAYLGYLRNEQEVVDDRASRREITAAYYRRNSNRIHALRQMAVRLVRDTGNDYVPELEAVTSEELGTLFEHPPKLTNLRSHDVVADKFRFLGTERSGEVFYLFARLDPYEQAELMQKRPKAMNPAAGAGSNANGQRIGDTTTRVRRVVPN
jgi:hypothetical protein